MPVIHIKSKLSRWVSQMDTTKKSTRNAHPYASQGAYLKRSSMTNNFITGYELSESYEKILADTKHAEHKLALERQEIEKILKVSLEGGSENEFLVNLRIDLCKVANRENVDNSVKLELNNAVDRVKYTAAIANGLVAPSKQDLLNNPYYLNCLYYFTDVKEEETAKKKSSKIKNQIGAKLVFFEENKLWLLAVNKILGLPTNKELSSEILYNQIDSHKDSITSVSELKQIEAIVLKPPHELLLDFTIKAAKDLMYIIVKEKGYYFRDLRICDSDQNVHEKLQLEKNEPILAAIKKLILDTYKITI